MLRIPDPMGSELSSALLHLQYLFFSGLTCTQCWENFCLGKRGWGETMQHSHPTPQGPSDKKLESTDVHPGTLECIRLVHRAMNEGYGRPSSSYTGRSAPSRDGGDPFLSPTLPIYSSLSLRSPLPFKPLEWNHIQLIGSGSWIHRGGS